MEKDNLQNFISCYESLHCFWQVTNEDYHNKQKRELAISKLMEAWDSEDGERITKDFVMKKITSLRTMYRKERNKVSNCKNIYLNWELFERQR